MFFYLQLCIWQKPHTSDNMKFLYVVSFLASAGASASELIPAKRMPQILDTRGSFYGGWPIAATTCPSNTTSCNDGSCCPGSSDCYTEGLAGVAVCCPNSKSRALLHKVSDSSEVFNSYR